jgi:adenosyl cobinamide kinase/adenosyl cobinamide phosphate guanylyltransferase
VDVQRRKRTRIIVVSCLGVVVALVILFQAIDMTRQHRIRQDVREALTSKLVSMDLKDAARVKSTIGNYFIPDVNSNKVRNDLMNTLYPQVLEYVNVFNLS